MSSMVNAPTVFRVGLLGEGIGASLTPSMHEREGRRLGLDYRYDTFDIPGESLGEEGLADLLRDLRRRGFVGLNVTHPFKQRVMAVLDDLSDEAERIGAVNLVHFSPTGTVGHNTDWTGFRSSLVQQLPGPVGTVLQVGAGGAGAATAYALLSLGAPLVGVHDVDVQRSAALVARYAPMFPASEVRVARADDDLWTTADGVVHATPVGMAHHPGLPFDPERLRADAWIAEVVYRPLHTELVTRARASGRRVMDGSLMAAGQAIDTMRMLTGLEPDPLRVRDDLVDLLRSSPQPPQSS